MNNVRLPETRQDHPRKVAAGDYGTPRFTPELVVPGAENRIEDERRQFDHAHADAAQARFGLCHQGNPRPAANDLRIDCERPLGVSGAHQRTGEDCEGMEIVGPLKKFCTITL